MSSDCGYESYSIFSGFNEDTFKTCIKGKGIKTDSCASCYAAEAKYGADNCKLACMSSWCSKGCLDCTAKNKASLDACTGFPQDPVTPCSGHDDNSLEAAAGSCSTDDQSFIKGHPGTDADSFGKMSSDCGYEAYSIFSGFNEDTFKTCIKGKGIKTDSCASCYAAEAKYGVDNCKLACISSLL
jgi:hypothetical protein